MRAAPGCLDCSSRHAASLRLGMLLLALATAHCAAPSAPADSVILIGIDGLDWRVLRQEIELGHMPHLAAFLARGAAGQLDTLLPTYSPSIWTTAATGKLPREHGITDFARRAESGDLVPYTSNSRRVKALWNILGEADKQVAVVGWWTTWPAESVRGVMVSDRMLYNRFNLWLGYSRHGADLPAQTHPPELFRSLQEAVRVGDDLDQELLGRFGSPAHGELQRNLHDPWYELFLTYARDEAYRKILDQVLAGGEFDFVAYYINGPDVASHYFWKHRFPEEWPAGVPEAEREAGAEVIGRYYAYVDESIGPLLKRADESCLVIVMSDHGFVAGGRPDTEAISGIHHDAAPPGVLAVAGWGVARGRQLERRHVLDVAPTVLYAMGLPVAGDMAGIVVPAVLRPDRPLETIRTYEPSTLAEPERPIATEFDPAILEKLEALGYLDRE